MNNQYLSNITIENYFSIEKIELSGLDKSKEIYFLGENGDGKTLVLQAILLALTRGKFENPTEKINKEEIGKIEQYLSENSNYKSSGKITKSDFDFKGNNFFPKIYAYGANRNKSTADFGGKNGFGKEGYLTLFDENRALQSPVQWLKNLKLEGRNSIISEEKAIKLLEEILDNNVKIEIKGSNVFFSEKSSKDLKFEQLSDGFKSVMTWVVDLVARLAENQPQVKEIQDFEGIVLVDEINLHLHPKWERNLVKKLRNWFPKIQFFFTTHSPTMLLSASRDAIFYKIYKENGHTKIGEPILCEKFANLQVNSLITSPLFDLENAYMEAYDENKNELDTSNTYLESKIREILKEKKQNQPKKYISETEFDTILNDTFEKYKNDTL